MNNLKLVLAMLSIPVFINVADCAQPSQQLPWRVIAEKFNAQAVFATDQSRATDVKEPDFALAPNSDIELPGHVVGSWDSINIRKWRHNSWRDSPLSAKTVSGSLRPNGPMPEGFYKIELSNGNSTETATVYAVVTADWKRELISVCRYHREQIETKPDKKLISSTIATSHFNNLLEAAADSPALTGNILQRLHLALCSREDFDSGVIGQFATGLNRIRLRRFKGARIAEFILLTPDNYSSTESLPLLVFPDARRVLTEFRTGIDDAIILWWHFPMPMDYVWKDYKYILDMVTSQLNVDRDRIYVRGECGNGIATIDLALRYPDHWAECTASIGNASRHLAGNALNLQVRFSDRQQEDPPDITSYYNFAVECFKFNECRLFTQQRGGFIPDTVREISPQRVFHTIDSLDHAKAYWVEINAREDENFVASIDAAADGQKIMVTLHNVSAYTLDLELAPVNCELPVEITENGSSLGQVTAKTFTRSQPDRYGIYAKDRLLNGPIGDVFTDAYVVVWRGDQQAKRLAEAVAGSGPCYAEQALPGHYIQSHNMIFVGQPGDSDLLADYGADLPVEVLESRVYAGDMVYEGDFGAIFIHPNPLNPRRYLAVLTATSELSRGHLRRAWNQITKELHSDAAIFQSNRSGIQWVMREKLDARWRWHDHWSDTMVNLSKQFPKWRWQQWTAQAIRKHLGSDVVVLENPFYSDELPGIGDLSLRDINRIFNNEWIIKISLQGRDLRSLLTIAFEGNLSDQISTHFVDGISLTRPMASDILWINELDDQATYKIAFPYQAINGTRLGMALDNYQIEKTMFLVPLLRDYLEDKSGEDIESALAGVQMNIY